MIEEFSDWLTTRQKEIEHVSALLSTELSNEPADLIEDLTVIEAWGSRVGELLATTEAYLSRAKLFFLPEGGEMRETERKAIVDDKVSDIRKTRDILESMRDCIKNRLILGESILRWEKPTHSPEIKDPNSYFKPQKSAAEIMRGA